MEAEFDGADALRRQRDALAADKSQKMIRATTRAPGRLGRIAAYLALGIAITVGSIALSLTVTPYSTVSAAGQTVSVGSSGPSFTLSGPVELSLFGQEVPTTVELVGPVRPSLVLRHISVDRQVSSLFSRHLQAGVVRSIGKALASGWTSYFVREALIAAAFALLLVGAFAGWLRMPWRRALAMLGAGLVLVETVNLGGVMLAAYGAVGRLGHVGSLEALVGRAPVKLTEPRTGPSPISGKVVVLGDSTAAGAGGPLVGHPSAFDRACARSTDSYARDMAAVNHWTVVNLACSGATIPVGLLGPQRVGGLTVPPQVSELDHLRGVAAVIVSVGANDVDWSGILRACAVATRCDNSAFTAYFQQRLQSVATSYLQLLQSLAALPSHPTVVVNLYYDPFDTAAHCLDHVGLNRAKETTLTALLNALNSVLAKGAIASSFTAAKPSFTGHALCDAQPYVQGLASAAPFHPTAAGELAIALADEQALLTQKHEN